MVVRLTEPTWYPMLWHVTCGSHMLVLGLEVVLDLLEPVAEFKPRQLAKCLDS